VCSYVGFFCLNVFRSKCGGCVGCFFVLGLGFFVLGLCPVVWVGGLVLFELLDGLVYLLEGFEDCVVEFVCVHRSCCASVCQLALPV
jgi:hypothetical protein